MIENVLLFVSFAQSVRSWISTLRLYWGWFSRGPQRGTRANIGWALLTAIICGQTHLGLFVPRSVHPGHLQLFGRNPTKPGGPVRNCLGDDEELRFALRTLAKIKWMIGRGSTRKRHYQMRKSLKRWSKQIHVATSIHLAKFEDKISDDRDNDLGREAR